MPSPRRLIGGMLTKRLSVRSSREWITGGQISI